LFVGRFHIYIRPFLANVFKQAGIPRNQA
jgi:hypothetical protein